MRAKIPRAATRSCTGPSQSCRSRLGGLHQCLKRVAEAGQCLGDLPRRHRYAIAATGLFACALAAAPPIARYLLPDSDSRPAVVDDELLTRLGLDIGQGLAYHVVVALGVVTVLAVMIALGDGTLHPGTQQQTARNQDRASRHQARRPHAALSGERHPRRRVLHRAHCGAEPDWSARWPPPDDIRPVGIVDRDGGPRGHHVRRNHLHGYCAFTRAGASGPSRRISAAVSRLLSVPGAPIPVG